MTPKIDPFDHTLPHPTIFKHHYLNIIQQLKKEKFGYSCSEYIEGSEVTIKFIKVQENGETGLKVVAEADGQVIDVKLKKK